MVLFSHSKQPSLRDACLTNIVIIQPRSTPSLIQERIHMKPLFVLVSTSSGFPESELCLFSFCSKTHFRAAVRLPEHSISSLSALVCAICLLWQPTCSRSKLSQPCSASCPSLCSHKLFIARLHFKLSWHIKQFLESQDSGETCVPQIIFIIFCFCNYPTCHKQTAVTFFSTPDMKRK